MGFISSLRWYVRFFILNVGIIQFSGIGFPERLWGAISTFKWYIFDTNTLYRIDCKGPYNMLFGPGNLFESPYCSFDLSEAVCTLDMWTTVSVSINP